MNLIQSRPVLLSAGNAGTPGLANAPIPVRGAFWRIVAVTNTYISSPGPTNVRRGRYPLRVLVDNAPQVVDGPEWFPVGEDGVTAIQLLGNDASDAALQLIAANLAGAGPATAAGLAYPYAIETTEVPSGGIVKPPEPVFGARGRSQAEVLLNTATWTLLDYRLNQQYDRERIIIQNNGPNPILIATGGEPLLIVAANYAPPGAGSPFLILNGYAAAGQAGGSLELDDIGWGVSHWGQATIANQVTGAATVVSES